MKKACDLPIPDGEFIRGQAPMTKEEIRTLACGALRIRNESVVLDIGAGTGSVSIECALRAPDGRVIAVEKDPAGIELIRANMKKFGVHNITVIHGEAPEALEGAGNFDRAFIGGSGGNLREILAWVWDHLDGGGIMTATAVTLDTAAGTAGFFREKGIRCDIIQVSITRLEDAAGHRMFRAQNPVFIMTAHKEQA